jgi:2-methylcitrate dehydratase PrpD
MTPTEALAAFGAQLTSDAIPDRVRQKAVDGVVDTIGACLFGATLPWSGIAIAYAASSGAGASTILGTTQCVPAAFAALANGTSAHACEIDNLRQPSVGVHPGAVLVPAALAIAEEIGASGRDLLTAYIAGFEVMARIGIAAHNTAEKIGFHSPALTGTFGAAIAAGRVLRLDVRQMTNALGIAGSLCSGILAFAKAGNGGMVKRLHMGRAAEGGVLAARLAQGGFDGPDGVIEGPFGFLDCFAREPDLGALTRDLGRSWETDRTCFKRYAAHVTAHTPLQAFEELRAEHPFAGIDIEQIDLATSEKVLSHHAGTAPHDVASAQYSVPICLAVAAFRDPNHPASFLGNPQDDAEILDLARRVKLTHNPETATLGDWATRLTVVLRNGRRLQRDRKDFSGAPSNPMSAADIDRKFLSLAGEHRRDLMSKLRAIAEMDDIRHLLG